MADKARHAFGSSQGISKALQSGVIDAYDILFLDGDTDNPKVGWIDKSGKAVIVEQKEADLSALEAEIATKVGEEEVNAKIDTAVSTTTEAAYAYADEKIEIAEKVKYEITHKPVGTLVNYSEKEIRVMCPADTKWVKQNVGTTGNTNMYYMGFKAYAPEGAVSFKEGDQGVVIDKMFAFDDDFAGTDELGRNYSICWLALASYDETSDTWTYYGKNSTTSKYIGWTYVVEWYDADGVMIATDAIRINLSNEECHSSIEPFYANTIIETANAYTDAKFADATSAIEIVEF